MTLTCVELDCLRPVAPADGRYCSAHSNKLSTPQSVQATQMGNTRADKPKSALVAANGINTSSDFTKFMGALMADLVENRVDSETANAACNAGNTLLKMLALRIRFGMKNEDVDLTESTGGVVSPPNPLLSNENKKV